MVEHSLSMCEALSVNCGAEEREGGREEGREGQRKKEECQLDVVS